MNVEKLKQAIDYSDVFNIIANGTCDMDDLDSEMKDRAANPSALQRRRKWLTEKPAYLEVEGGQVIFDVDDLAKELDELRNLVLPGDYGQDTVRELEGEIEMFKRQIADLTSELQEYSQKVSLQEDYISKLKAELSKKTGGSLKSELERKVLVAEW